MNVEALTGAGVDVVFVLPVSGAHLARFVADTAAPPSVAARLFANPGASIAAAAGCTFRFDSRATFTSPHAQTSVLGATLRGLSLGLRTGPQGDPRQQGGAWVLELQQPPPAGDGGGDSGDGGGGVARWTTVWVHRDRHNADQVPLPLLVAVAGGPPGAYVHPRPAPPTVAAAGGVDAAGDAKR
jgi:hypothetical protein